MERGDFIVHFMDTAAVELRKPISRELNTLAELSNTLVHCALFSFSEVSMTTLNSLLEWALRTSSADSDPYKDNLRFVCAFHSLQMPDGLSSLALAKFSRPLLSKALSHIHILGWISQRLINSGPRVRGDLRDSIGKLVNR